MEYIPRLIDQRLERALSSHGAVLIEGPRGCGKTRTALEQSKSQTLFDVDKNAALAVSLDPDQVMQGPWPRLLDEWQVVPDIWNLARRAIDHSQAKGAFILTGSATAPVDSAMHSGASRIERLRMRPMALCESKRPDGGFSISAALAGNEALSGQVQTLTFDALLNLMCVGGWPSNIALDAKLGASGARSYLRNLLEQDFRNYASGLNGNTATAVITEVARNVGSTISVEAMAKNISRNRGPTKAETVQSYIDQFVRLNIIEIVPSWNASLRSRYSVAKSPKRYMTDPSLAIAALKATPSKLKSDLRTTGFMFENLVIRDLLSIMEASDGQVFHYRDESQLEVDAVIEDFDGNWGAIEVKLGFGAVDNAAKQLLNFAKKIDTDQVGHPKFLAVVTQTEYNYQRPDGVYVLSANALQP